MTQTGKTAQVCHRGNSITPLAAYDGGLYAAMVIIGDPQGQQRASGVLGHFPSAEEACSYAVVFGKEEIDRRDVNSAIRI
jgi:hypothetical protein